MLLYPLLLLRLLLVVLGAIAAADWILKQPRCQLRWFPLAATLINPAFPADVTGNALRRTFSSALLSRVLMSADYPTILLAGRDPDLLLLRSAVLAAADMWSARVRNAEQASQVLAFVDCDLAVCCYTLDENERQKLTTLLLDRHNAVRVLQVVAGDDCSGFGFLRKVQVALSSSSPTPLPALEPVEASSRMVR